MRPTRHRHLAVWVLLSLIWGSTWLFIKVGLADLPPFTFAGLRFLVAVVPLFVLVWARRLSLPSHRGDWCLIIGTGLLTIGLPYGLVFWAELHISSGLAALLFSTFPLFGLILAHFHLHTEPLTRIRVVGVVLGIAGVGLVLSNELAVTGRLALWGSAAVVLAALLAAWADVLIKLRGAHLDPAVLTLGQMIAGLVPLMLAGAMWEGNPLAIHWTALAVFSLLYLALVGSALAFVLFYWLVQRIAVTTTMLIVLVTPLIAVSLGVVFLDEELTWQTIAGGLAILGGVALSARSV